MSFFDELIKKIFGSLNSGHVGNSEVISPFGQAILGFMDTWVFKVLYFIPLMILRGLNYIVNWYYNTFMLNPESLQSDLIRLLFVYIIPGIVFLIIFNLLRFEEWTGLKILLTSPVIFVLFPLIFIGFLLSIPEYVSKRPRKKVGNMLDRFSYTVKLKPEQETGNYKADKGIKRGIVGEKVLEYALKLTPGYKKVFSSLYIPVGKDVFTEVDSVLVNKRGVFVWEAKYHANMYYYGKLDDDFWYEYRQSHLKSEAIKEIETGERGKGIKRFPNPLKQNRAHVNAIQKQLRTNGFGTKNIHMFSGVSFGNMYEEDCEVESRPDEIACYVGRVPEVMKNWGKMSKSELSRDDVNKIATFLGQFVDESDERKEAHIKKLKEIYGEIEEKEPERYVPNYEFEKTFFMS